MCRSRSTKLAFPLLFIAASFLSVHAQSSTNSPKPATGNEVIEPFVPSKSKVRGRAIFDDTGSPAVDALVHLLEPNGYRPKIAMTTNERGGFSFGGIPAGEYYVVVQPMEDFEPGYPSFPNPFRMGDEEFDKARLEAFTRGFPKITIDGNNSVQIDVRVPRRRGSMISGQVTGPNSTPLLHASVSILRQLQKGLVVIQSVRTGPDGSFRVGPLPVGDYLVRAIGLDKKEILDDVHKVELPNAVYFVSTTDVKDAAPVTVFEGQDTKSINISLEPQKRATVSGSLRMQGSGKPLANVMVGLRGGGRDYFMKSDENGRWSFSHVAPATYTLQVGSSGLPADAPLPPQPFIHRYQELTVGESDIKDFVVELLEGGRISGTVALERGTESKPRSISIIASSETSDGQSPAGARVTEDGRFSMSGVPIGQITLRVSTWPMKAYVTKSILWNGVDLLKDKLAVSDEAEIRNVVIVIAPAGPR